MEDSKQKTERQKIVLAEVVKAQKELILANSKVQFSLPIYFCFVFSILFSLDECNDKAIL